MNSNVPSTFKIRPNWRVLAPGGKCDSPEIGIILTPGAGWGSGAHETTQLCLQALTFSARQFGTQWSMLDFGSGSGILSIAGAKLGAQVDGVEIDPLAIANAEENACLNEVEGRIRFATELPPSTKNYTLVVANILRPVLLEFAEPLAARLNAGGTLILSGLVSTDLPEVTARYASFLGGLQPSIYRLGEWRALVWTAKP